MVRDFLIRKEIIHSESLGRCSMMAALAWHRLLQNADNHGRFNASPRVLKLNMVPFHDEGTVAVIEGWLNEYERERMIKRWTIDDSICGEIINYRKWNPNLRYTKSGSKILKPEELEQIEEPPSTRLPADVLEAIENALPGRVKQTHFQKAVQWMYGSTKYSAAEVVNALGMSHGKEKPFQYADVVLRNARDQQKLQAEAPRFAQRKVERLPTEEESRNG